MRALRVATAAVLLSASVSLRPASAPAEVLERAVARFYDPEAGTAGGLRFVYMRELVLQAWLVGYERAADDVAAPDDKSIRVALERQVVEQLLSSRPLPAAMEAKVESAAKNVRMVLQSAVGGPDRLEEALAHAAGKPAADDSLRADLDGIIRRRARAELFLEAAVVQPVEVRESDVRAAWLKLPAATRRPLVEMTPLLAATIRSVRLRETAQAYYQVVRTRLRLELIEAGTAK